MKWYSLRWALFLFFVVVIFLCVENPPPVRTNNMACQIYKTLVLFAFWPLQFGVQMLTTPPWLGGGGGAEGSVNVQGEGGGWQSAPDLVCCRKHSEILHTE